MTLFLLFLTDLPRIRPGSRDSSADASFSSCRSAPGNQIIRRRSAPGNQIIRRRSAPDPAQDPPNTLPGSTQYPPRRSPSAGCNPCGGPACAPRRPAECSGKLLLAGLRSSLSLPLASRLGGSALPRLWSRRGGSLPVPPGGALCACPPIAGSVAAALPRAPPATCAVVAPHPSLRRHERAIPSLSLPLPPLFRIVVRYFPPFCPRRAGD